MSVENEREKGIDGLLIIQQRALLACKTDNYVANRDIRWP
jgi:hypothetical protein